MKYVNSKCQVADYLTKTLATKQFRVLLNKSNVGEFKPRGSGDGVDRIGY